MTLETLAIATSILASAGSLLAVAMSRRPARPSGGRTITITLEDSSGARTRTIAASTRRLDDLKRDIERLLRNAA